MALQISEEVERNRLEELEAELFVTDSEFERSADDVNNDTSEKIVEDEIIGNVDYVARKNSVGDIFADTVERIQDEDTSSDEYFNRQPSGRVASLPSLRDSKTCGRAVVRPRKIFLTLRKILRFACIN